MPLPFGEIATKDLLKYPKTVVLYACLVGIGWIADKIIPNDCQKEVQRWQSAFEREERRADHLSSANNALNAQHNQDVVLTKQQSQTIKTIDSLLNPLGNKAKEIIKQSKP